MSTRKYFNELKVSRNTSMKVKYHPYAVQQA